MTPSEYEEREKAYQQMAALVQGVDKPTVVIALHGPDAHVHIQVPGTDDLAELKLAGQKAYYALTLYLAELDVLIARQGMRKADDVA